MLAHWLEVALTSHFKPPKLKLYCINMKNYLHSVSRDGKNSFFDMPNFRHKGSFS